MMLGLWLSVPAATASVTFSFFGQKDAAGVQCHEKRGELARFPGGGKIAA